MIKRIVISILALLLFVNVGLAQNTTNFDRIKLDKSDATYGDLIFKNGEFITNDTDGTLSFGSALLTLTGVVTIGTGIVADAQDGAYIGSTSLQFSDIFLADGAVIAFGDDGEVTLTHVADTGLLLTDASGVGTTQLQFGDAGTYIYQVSDGILGIVSDTEVDITVTDLDINAAVSMSGLVTIATGMVADAQDGAYLGTSSLQFSDLFLADGAVVALGDDGDVTLTHIADTGVLLTDDSGVGTTQLQFGDAGTYVYQVSDGILGLVADTEVDITVTTLDINGLVDISGELTLSGSRLVQSGTGATTNNTFADSVDVTGEVTATTIVTTGSITDGTYTSDGSGNFTGIAALTTTGLITIGGLVDGNGTGIATDNTFADTVLVTGQVSATTGFTDGTMTIDGSGGFTGVASIDAILLTTDGYNQPGVAVTNASTYAVLAANTGKVHIIGDFGQACSITLPTEAAGLNYEFWYYGPTAETHDDTLLTTGNSNGFKGGLMFADTADAISAVYPNGTTNSKMTLLNMHGGTRFKVFCDGTNWFITGTVVSDVVPVFADQ